MGRGTTAAPVERKFGALEEGINLTVIAGEMGKCQRCGERAMVFTCHLFREGPAGKIEELCQGCTVTRAGGVAKVYVRSSEYVQRKWKGNAPLERQGGAKGKSRNAIRVLPDGSTARPEVD
jgi:hypothetical protein